MTMLVGDHGANSHHDDNNWWPLAHFISSPVAANFHPITLLLSSRRYTAGAVRDKDGSWTRVIEEAW